MTNRRLPTLLRGLGALLATAVLLVGVPVGLAIFVGWPLPTSIPSGDAMAGALNTGITDTFIVNAIAVIAWLAWAQLAIAFIAEAATAVRGRPSLRLPVAPGFQVAASRLVAGILMLAAPLQPARAAAAEAQPPVVATITEAPRAVVQSAPTPTPAAEPEAATTPAQPVQETRTITVERHDTYWEIAERELGDGFRWHEIQILNVGRTMPDGHVIAPGDDTLRAGWTLDIASTDAQAATGGEIEVQAGDNLWTLAEHQLATDLGRPATEADVAPYWTEVIDANHDRLVDPTDPSLIHVGQTIALPPTGHAAPLAVVEPVTPEPVVVEAPPDTEAEAPPEEPATSTTTTTVVPEESEPEPAAAAAPVAADSDLDHADDGTPLPLIAVTGGLTSVALAVGAKRLIERRRREHLLDHDKLPEPQPEQRQLHQTITAMADEDLIGHLNYALGELAVTFADTGLASRPRVVRHSPDGLEILLTDPAPIDIPGWRSDGDGQVLTLDHTINLDIDLDGPRCAAPLMVTIGQREEGANLYLDLEAEGIIALVGDVESARRLARSILTELAVSPLADHNRVITIGDLVEPAAEALPRLTRLETWHDLAEDLHTWLTASHRALDLNAWPNAFVGRGHDPDHEALVPMVVIAAKPPPPDMLDDLVGAFPSAVAVVVADEMEGSRTSIHCEPDEIRLDDIGLAFTPQRVDTDALETLGRAITISTPNDDEADDDDHREGFDLHDLDDGESEVEVTSAEVEADSEGPPEYDILVRLLGDIRIEGATKTVHPKATSVIAYLALNRSVTSERLEEACWFGSNGTSHRKRLRETMTICRDAIGSQHLPPNENGTYTIGPRVRTDLDLFEWHVTRACEQPPEQALESYRQALGLVVGHPFSYPSKGRQSFGWVDFEHHSTTWEGRIANVANALTMRCVGGARCQDVVEILRNLVQVLPLHEGAVAALMRVLIGSGHRSSAVRVYREHLQALDNSGLGSPDDWVGEVLTDQQSGG